MASLTEISIKRPALITMVVLGLVVLGLFSYGKMGVDLYPNVNFPVVAVTVTYPGASPKEIETSVVKPIEESIGTIAGLDQIRSTCSDSFALIIVQFKLESNIDTVAVDVQNKIDAISNKFPKDVERPIITKADINAMPIMTFSVTSPRPPGELFFIVKDRIKPQMERVNGVAKVDMFGAEEREIQIQLRKNALRARGLSVSQVVQLLQQDNLTIPAGSIDQGKLRIDLRAPAQFKDLKEIANWPLRLADGSVIPLSSIAYIRDTHVKTKSIVRTNMKTSIGLQVVKQSDASVVAVAKELRQVVKELKGIPADVKLEKIADNATFIEESLRGVLENLVEGVLFTAIILLLFFGSVPSTFIVLLAIPTSLISTFTIMYFSGFTLNVMTLMALGLTIGILVDDSIVVLENIHRHLEKGEDPLTAAIQGRLEIAPAAVAITLIDVVVFLPIGFMSGILGMFFKPFALTIVTATLFSLFISFTLTPMLSYFFLRIEKAQHFIGLQWFLDWWENMFVFVRDLYGELINWALDHKGIIIGISIVLFIWSMSLVPRGKIGTEFLPETDESEFSISMTMPITTPLTQTDRVARQVEGVLAKVKEVKTFQMTVGPTSGGSMFVSSQGGTNGIVADVILVNLSSRKRSVNQIMAEVRNKLKDIPGALTVVSASDAGPGGGDPIQVEILGNDLPQSKKVAEQVFQLVQKTKGTVDVQNSWFEGKQEYQVRIDRRQAAELGLSVAQIASILRTSIEGTVISRYSEENRESDIRVLLAPEDRTQLKDIKNLPLVSVKGRPILLTQVARVQHDAGPVQISRKDRDRRIVITAGILGKTRGLVMKDIKTELAKLSLPESVRLDFGNVDKNQRESFQDLMSSLMLSILLIYMLMVALYGSYRYPFVNMFTLPVAVIGALGLLMWTGRSLNIFSMVGLIMLMGLVTKNGILIVDFTNKYKEEGMDVRRALIEAGSTRLRPIVMTTLSTVCGMLPLALAFGSGAEIRAGLATVVIGGLLSSLLLTLVLIPVVYEISDNIWDRLTGRRKRSMQYE
jgi:HAE1 family hydrophobic/amphiphilic exporter-1